MSYAEALARLGCITDRSPFPYATSWPIEEITLARPAGAALVVLLKQYVGVDARSGPASLRDTGREPMVYRLLESRGVSVPRYLGGGGDWLLVERLDGQPLWQADDLGAWLNAARWAAGLHSRFVTDTPRSERLLVRDARFFRACFERALADDEVRAREQEIGVALERAITRLSCLPVTLIHGELYPSNVVVGSDDVAAVDFEMAGLGPGVIDLAALITGWSGEARSMILSAYGGVDPDDLAAAQLVLALQWIGWDRSWDAPPEHRHDWLGETLAAVEALT